MKVIAIDAMGGDNAPAEIVKGAVEASKSVKYNLALVGKEEIVNAELSKYNYDKSKITVVNASLVPIFRFYAQDRHIFHQTLKNN